MTDALHLSETMEKGEECMAQQTMTRQEAIEELQQYNIHDAQIYLIDIIPLIEILWADGKVQLGEIAILNEYLKKHVSHVNQIAGDDIITLEEANDFASRFLKKRPDPQLLKTLRSFITPIRFSCSNKISKELLRESLLAACLDIAAISVADYPYQLHERFNPAEKRCFFEILESLECE